jgi:hypothetical protein
MASKPCRRSIDDRTSFLDIQMPGWRGLGGPPCESSRRVALSLLRPIYLIAAFEQELSIVCRATTARLARSAAKTD